MADGAAAGVAALRAGLAARWKAFRRALGEQSGHGDGSNGGSISLDEWLCALSAVGIPYSEEDAIALFDHVDASGSGELNVDELHAELRGGPSGPSATQRFALRRDGPGKRGSNVVGDLRLGGSSASSVIEKLSVSLASNHSRTIDLFREWDADGSGTIELSEFVGALRQLGLDCPDEEMADAFARLDDDCSGAIDYAELHTRLRPRIPRAERQRQKQKKPRRSDKGVERRDVGHRRRMELRLPAGPCTGFRQIRQEGPSAKQFYKTHYQLHQPAVGRAAALAQLQHITPRFGSRAELHGHAPMAQRGIEHMAYECQPRPLPAGLTEQLLQRHEQHQQPQQQEWHWQEQPQVMRLDDGDGAAVVTCGRLPPVPSKRRNTSPERHRRVLPAGRTRPRPSD